MSNHRYYTVSLLIIGFQFLISGCVEIHRQVPQPISYQKEIMPGDTLLSSLSTVLFAPQERQEIITALQEVFNPRLCKPGHRYEVLCNDQNQWTSFKYHTGGIEYYEVHRDTAGAVQAQKVTATSTLTSKTSRGTIQSSLWEAMSSKGIPAEVIMGFADIFAWQIDFLTEPRAGDTYKVTWESMVNDRGDPVQHGLITGAQYIASGKTYTAVLYRFPNGKHEYFTPQGKSLRRAFLRAPLQFRRISSYFTKRRFHPVHKIYRPHLGIDYAAQAGTPVSSIGSGRIVLAGWKGGYGKCVRIRHANGYVSQYGHLSRYAQGIKTGTMVSQGQLIGYVGSTGVSTGAHLDFRVEKNNKPINFLALNIPDGAGVSKEYRERFAVIAQVTLTQLAQIHH